MAALGEKLRREREARGVSLREIALATRIHENFLRALEENDYGALPGAVFVTGFLRNYSAHLGLDADKIVAEFEAMKIEPPEKPRAIPGMVVEESKTSTLWVVGSLFLILVVYVAYVSWPVSAPDKSKPAVGTVPGKVKKPDTYQTGEVEPTGGKEAAVADSEKAVQPPAAQPPVAQPPGTQPPAAQPPAAQPPSAQPPSAQPSAAQPPVVQPSAAQPPVVQPPVAKPSVKKTPVKKTPILGTKIKPPVPAVTKKKPAPKADLKKRAAKKVKPVKKKKAAARQDDVATVKKKYKHRLVVKAQDEDAWILVVVDDELERDMFVRAGQRIVLRGNESFNFTTGNASQISLTLNGKPLDFKIPKSNVLRSWNIPLPETE